MSDPTRLSLIETAIQAYLDAGRKIPLEWISEYLLIIQREHKESRFRIVLTNH